MKKLLILLTALAVSMSAAAGGEKCDGAAEDCMAKMKTKLAEKAWLGVEFDKNEHGQMVIKKVFDDSPAEQAGFQKGDVMLAMQGVEYNKENKAAMKKVYAGIKPGSDVQYVVKRQGAKVELDATLAHVPKDVQKKWIAGHMKEQHPEFQVASKN
jgi:predicted metalloprotease with PDZ domain